MLNNTNNTYPTPLELLPHRPPMIVVSKVLHCDIQSGWLTAEILPTKDDVFYQPQINGIPSYFAMEYMAQSIGCFAGIYDIQQNKKSGIGFLLGTKKLQTFTNIIHINKKYKVDIKQLFMEENLASFECKIFDDKDTIIAEATINTYRPNEGEAKNFIKEQRK